MDLITSHTDLSALDEAKARGWNVVPMGRTYYQQSMPRIDPAVNSWNNVDWPAFIAEINALPHGVYVMMDREDTVSTLAKQGDPASIRELFLPHAIIRGTRPDIWSGNYSLVAAPMQITVPNGSAMYWSDTRLQPAEIDRQIDLWEACVPLLRTTRLLMPDLYSHTASDALDIHESARNGRSLEMCNSHRRPGQRLVPVVNHHLKGDANQRRLTPQEFRRNQFDPAMIARVDGVFWWVDGMKNVPTLDADIREMCSVLPVVS